MNTFLLRALDRVKLIGKFNFSISKKICGRTFKIPVINGTGHKMVYSYEEWYVPFLKKILPVTEGAFVDVGVNIGQTLLKVAAIDPSKEYIGFEPNPFAYYYANKLCRLNNIKYTLYPVGLSSETTVLTLHMDTDMASGASVLENFRKNKARYNKKLLVPVFKGDDLMQKHEEKIGCIKADVEGAELEVMMGLGETIKKHKPLVILEILPVYSLEVANGVYRKERQEKLLAIMASLGYDLYLIDEATVKFIKLTGIEVHGDIKKTNYLFIPSDRQDQAEKLVY